MITGQKPILRSKQGRFQIVDIVQMMKPLTKFSKQIVNGDNIPAVVRDALRLAQEERPGAVHIELPEDIAREQTTRSVLPVHAVHRPNARNEAIREAVERIQRAERPLLLVGASANRRMISKELKAFLEKTGMYFFNTQMGKGVVDELHPHFLGTAALSANDYVHCAISRADLIINVGHDVIEKPPFFMEQGGKEVIHVNFFTAEIDQIYFPQWEVVGDIASNLHRLTEEIVPQKTWDFSYYGRMKEEVEKHISAGSKDHRFPIIPQRIVADVRASMPDDGILSLDNGMYKIWFARNYKARQPNTVLLDNALATMGAGLPGAMCANLLFPDRAVMCVCGDGGFLMNSQDLETAVRLKLKLTIVLLRDNGYGMIRWKQEDMGLPDFALGFGNPDFVQYAESFGVHAERIETADQLLPTLRRCLVSPGISLIDVPVEYSENHRILTVELKEKTCIL
jgi:acetolactate synthase-1/2/3 large subunit